MSTGRGARTALERIRAAVGRWTSRRLAVTVGLGVFVVMVARLLFPSPIGLADHGEGQRFFCQVGLRAEVERTQAPEDLVVLRWRDHTYYGETCGASEAGGTIHTTQRTLLIGARALSPLFGTTGGVDLRALAVVVAAALGVVAAILVCVVPGGRPVALLVTVAVVAAVVDRGVAGVFVSAHRDGAALVGLAASVAAALALLGRPTARPGALVALAAAGAFTAASLPQMVSVAPVVAAGLLWRPSRVSDPDRRSTREWLRSRALGAVLAALVLGLGLWSLGTQPATVTAEHRHDQVFGTMLVRSDHPEADLAWLSVDTELAHLAGSSSSTREDLVRYASYRSFEENVGWSDIVRFYVLHPARLVDLGALGLEAAARYRDGELASHPVDAGVPPGILESRVRTTSFLFALAGAAPVLLAVVQTAALVAAIQVARRRRCSGAMALALVAAGLGLAAITMFWMVVFAVGQVGLVRHLLVFDVALVWSAVLAVAAVVLDRRAAPRPTAPTPRPSTAETEPEPEPDWLGTSLDELLATSDLEYLDLLRSRSTAPSPPPQPRQLGDRP